MKYMVMLVAAVTALLAPAEDASTLSRWLGTGGDNKWTTPENWDNGVPGAWKSGDVANDGLTITAVFGPVTEGAATTIDLANVEAVSNMVIAAGAPAYTFGASASQSYYLHACGSVTVEEGVTTDQTFRCLYPARWGDVGSMILARESSITNRTYFYHNGSGQFVANAFLNSYNHRVNLYGTGTFVLTNNITESGGFLYDYSSGRMVVGDVSNKGYFKVVRHEAPEADGVHTVEIPEGMTFCVRDWTSGLKVFYASIDVLYTGGGVFYFRNSNTDTKPATHAFKFQSTAGHTATFDVDIHAGSCYDIKDPLMTTPVFISSVGSGTMVWKKQFRVAEGYEPHGYFTFAENAGGTLRLAKMGNLGQGAEAGYNFGELEPVFNKSGTIEWTGDGDSVNRALGFTAKATATLKNSGTGTLVYTGVVTQNVDDCTLALNAATAPIEFKGTKGSDKTLNLITDGEVTVADLGMFAKADIGGTLKIEAATGDFSNFAITTHSADTRVELPANCHLAINKISIANNSSNYAIDFIVPESSSLTYVGHAAGDIISWCKVNGALCYSDADGKLHSYRKDWIAPVAGEWTDAAKWTGAEAPHEKSSIFIIAAGADYTVNASGPLGYNPSMLTIGNGESAHTATLAVKGTMGLTNCYLSVKKGGEILLDGAGGTSALIHYGSDYNKKAIDGGRVVVTNGGDLRISSNFPVAGELLVYEDSILRSNDGGSRTVTVAPAAAGETARIAFVGKPGASATLSGGNLYAGGTKGGTVKVDLHGTGTENFTPGTSNGEGIAGWYLGVGNGLTLTDFTGGYVKTGNWGVRVGATSKGVAPVSGTCFPTSIVMMTGGKISYSGWNNAQHASYCGLIVGDGALVASAGNDTKAYGEFNLAGGELVSNCGYFMVGVGQAEGVFNQSGGTITHNETSFTSKTYFKEDGTSTYIMDAYIGLAGGRGSYTQTGGEFSAKRDVFIGGRPFEDMGRSTNGTLSAKYHDRTRQDAAGVLKLQGGTFTTTQRVIMGAWGTGELVLGNGGYLSADSLVMSNATASVLTAQVNGDTRRKVTGEASGGVELAGKLVITDGAKLVVDATTVTKQVIGYRQLVKCAQVEGAFAKIEIKVDEALDEAAKRRLREGEVVYSLNGEAGVWYRPLPPGMMIIMR